MTVTTLPSSLPTLGTTMQAMRFHGVEDLRLEDIPVPKPGPGEVRIRPLAVGICGTDAHIFHGEFPAEAPRVLGHEMSGLVDAVGAGVEGLSEGDFVTVQPNTFCGSCRYCRLGREHLCPNMRAYGVHMDGGFAQATVAIAKTVYRLPGGLDPRVGCLAEPLACCIHGMDLANVRSGSTVLVIGAGLIGLALMRLARLAGAGLIVASEPNALRRQNALAFGADRSIDPKASDAAAELRDLTNGLGFDVVIDAVGAAITFEQAIAQAARGATVLAFGVAPIRDAATVRPYDIFQRELTIVGSFINPYTHERAVSLLPQMGFERLQINAFPLADFQNAFAAQATSTAAAKVEILPQQ